MYFAFVFFSYVEIRLLTLTDGDWSSTGLRGVLSLDLPLVSNAVSVSMGNGGIMGCVVAPDDDELLPLYAHLPGLLKSS